MADLEDLGYVFQPHTSAGRIPTDRGYRFFIDHLMKSRKLTLHERGVIDENVSRTSELDEVMHLCSRLLSKLSDQVGLVFMPTLEHLTMRSLDLVPVADRRVMCIIVGTNGVVADKMIQTEQNFSRDELGRIARYITSEFAGLTLDEVRLRMQSLLDEERARYDELLRSSMILGLEVVGGVLPHEHELFVEGTNSILSKPEFANADAMRKTMLALQEKEKLVKILNQLNEDGLRIVVGSESQFTHDYNLSMVVTKYGSASRPHGVVGIIGPTRMEYGRISPLVAYLGQVLSRKIEETEEERGS